jgi:hypothetical protein
VQGCAALSQGSGCFARSENAPRSPDLTIATSRVCRAGTGEFFPSALFSARELMVLTAFITVIGSR